MVWTNCSMQADLPTEDWPRKTILYFMSPSLVLYSNIRERVEDELLYIWFIGLNRVRAAWVLGI